MSIIGEEYFEDIDEKCPKCDCKDFTATVKTIEIYHKGENGVGRDEFPTEPIAVSVTCDNCGEVIDEWETIV